MAVQGFARFTITRELSFPVRDAENSFGKLKMNSLRGMVLGLLQQQNGLTDEEIAYQLRQFVPSTHAVSLICRQFEAEGLLKRIKRIGKPSGNYLTEEAVQPETIEFAPEAVAEPVDDSIPVGKGQEHINDLKQIGFRWVGDFYKNENHVSFSIGENGDMNDILVAFVVDGAVVCFMHSLRSLGHCLASLTSGSATGNLGRYQGYIKGLLQRDSKIEIYALSDPGGLQYAGHKLSLCTGIFPALIEHFHPAWNKNSNDAAA